jgi:hypothetical protein
MARSRRDQDESGGTSPHFVRSSTGDEPEGRSGPSTGARASLARLARTGASELRVGKWGGAGRIDHSGWSGPARPCGCPELRARPCHSSDFTATWAMANVGRP